MCVCVFIYIYIYSYISITQLCHKKNDIWVHGLSFIRRVDSVSEKKNRWSMTKTADRRLVSGKTNTAYYQVKHFPIQFIDIRCKSNRERERERENCNE